MCVSLCQSEPVTASALRGQKGVPAPSKLYLQAVVCSLMWVLKITFGSSERAVVALNC